MATTSLPRLPRKLFPAGPSVAVRPPLVPGFVAHRSAIDERPTGATVMGTPVRASVPVPACDTKAPRHGLVTAHWADHLGAQACTAPACFPNAVPANGPALEEPATATPAETEPEPDAPAGLPSMARALGIRPDTEVWIAAARRDIEAHRVDGPLTGCGRATRTGERLTAMEVTTRYRARWCRRCWSRDS